MESDRAWKCRTCGKKETDPLKVLVWTTGIIITRIPQTGVTKQISFPLCSMECYFKFQKDIRMEEMSKLEDR